MNQQIEQLAQIGNRTARTVIGLMSGTSLDGLDIALCRITGSGPDTQVDLKAFETVPYTAAFRKSVRKIFAKTRIAFEDLVLLNPYIAQVHGDMVLQCLEKWKIPAREVDILASHGQTVFHAPFHQHRREPFGNATLQIGDGDHLAVRTGIITVSDFRQKHIAAGGEGAPLAVYGDYLVFSKKGDNRLLLNIGGIANFTYLPGDGEASRVFCTDTGPGNTLMDAFVRKHFPGMDYDPDGQLAGQGVIQEGLLAALQDLPFFSFPFPKTTGPEVFSLAYVEQAMQKSGALQVSPEDVMATLNRFSAETIAAAIRRVAGTHEWTIYVSGGGAHNQVLLGHLRALLPNIRFEKMATLGINGDAKEAVLFAVLANELVAGRPLPFNAQMGIPAVVMGKISLP